MNPFLLDQHIHNNRVLDHQHNTGQATKADLKPLYIDNNVLDVDLDTPIYRIFNEKRFFQMLESKSLVLLHTRFWEDPFENFLLNARWEMADGTPVGMATVRDRYYGQCWTLREECDGLWRNYRGTSPDPEAAPAAAVKVATTVGKLMDQFYDVNTPGHELTYFLGKVRYCTDSEINDYFMHPEVMNSAAHQVNVRIPQTMLVKRQAFSYEEEVRLIYSDKPDSTRNAPPSNGLHPVPIDPNALFDYIELDPTMKAPAKVAAEARIQAAGYTGTVRQSALYQNPSFVVKLA